VPPAHHLGITVSDLDRVLTFYREVLDLPVLARFSVSGEAFATGVDVPGGTGRFVHLDADGIVLELVEYDPQAGDGHAEGLNQPGATHLGLEVTNLDAFHDSLPADVETLSPPQTTESGTRICFLRDPEGNLVELLEP